MILQLFRQYEENRTLGLIKMNGKTISKTLENPQAFKAPWLKEGKYQLLLRYCEKIGWYIEIYCPGPEKFRFRPLKNGKIMPKKSIAPVLYWNHEAKFSKLATLKFMEKLEASFASGDQVWLEISRGMQQCFASDGLAD
ncbi:DUF5675 family protein [Mongoliitalea daihaiensis]|uniref:DUF5675 family protein n=1 Tax=Mongoliitalea daihaiensis TaxID=2782006 RepID=UPI001F26A964|nr:DUF5675 family protein [Mongoliitalea daihaiensis]UJP64875.1 hypothetical protein IPZ59_19120 [Mongoliitalea daihaiensis]